VTKRIRLWPVPGRFLLGVPAVECEVDPERAAELVATGAFTDQPPAAAEPMPADAGPDITED
jgi:hypothetical protein